MYEDTSVKEVVIEMTLYPLGAACVLNKNEELVGLITDGDLRRTLYKFDGLNDVKAKDIMTLNPVVIEPNISLGIALEKMEEGKSAISVLPVLDCTQKGISGMIRIHDILNS